MTLKPLDIQQQSFPVVFRGYDRVEVTDFLDMVRRDYEALIHANLELTGRLTAMERELDEARTRETELRDLLAGAALNNTDPAEASTASSAATLAQAKAQAELIEREAELKAERILHEAQTRVANQRDALAELSRNRQRLEASLRNILDACVQALDHEPSAVERLPVRSPDHDEPRAQPPETLGAASSSVELSAAS
ncbi:MAG: DivIVA domain-containing protein [Myxococcota bacterium]